MRDTDGKTWSMQTIAPDGAKRFTPGGRVRGCYYSIGKPAGVLVVAEGFATGASIHEATGCAVAVAFNAGNLKAVAEGRFTSRGLPGRAESLADRLLVRDREGDDRRMCIECRHCTSGRSCGRARAAGLSHQELGELAVMLQR